MVGTLLLNLFNEFQSGAPKRLSVEMNTFIFRFPRYFTISIAVIFIFIDTTETMNENIHENIPFHFMRNIFLSWQSKCFTSHMNIEVGEAEVTPSLLHSHWSRSVEALL